MKPTNVPPQSDFVRLGTVRSVIHIPSFGLSARLGAILILAGLLVSSFYSASSASSAKKAPINQSPPVVQEGIRTTTALAKPGTSPLLGVSNYFPLLPVPQAGVSVTTYAGDCATPKTVFNLQDSDKTVCAKVTGPQFPWRIIWSNSKFVAVQNVAVGSGTSTFTLTSASSLGDWRVILFEPFGGSVLAVTSFTVIDANNPVADVSISKGTVSGNASAGAQVVFSLQVTNAGPSDATAVQLVDVVPTATTFVSFSQLEGPVFSCNNPALAGTGTTVCTVASLSRGDRATFLATYLVDAGASAGDSVSNTATVSSAVADSNPENNYSTASVPVTPSPCVLTCPSNIIQSVAAGDTGATVTYPPPTTSGNCGQSVISNPASGSFFPLGTTTVTTTTSTGGACTFQVTIQNPGGLAISLNGANPFALECGDNFADPGATAVNGVGNPVPVVVSGTLDDHAPASYTLTYTATEGANSVSTSRTVNVSDSEAPVITLNGQNPMTLSSGQPFINPGASASDDCEGARPVTSSGTVDTNTPGTYTVTYTASDSAGHTATSPRTVIVEGAANGAPTIIIDGGVQMSIECGSNFIDPGATATFGGASVPVTSTGTVDSHALASYVITYTACIEDTPGHCDPNRTAQALRTVTVEDTTGPTIEILGANPMTVECHTTTFTDPGATAHDGCAAGNLATTASSTVDVNTVGEYTITYNATDPSGNPADPVARTVNVVDTTGPVITAPGPVTVNTGAGATSCDATISDAALGTGSASDACEGPLATSRSGVPAGNVFPVGETTLTYSAIDAHNNTGTATQLVTVIDNTPPTISLTGANPQIVECHTSYPELGATANDNCRGTFAATPSGSVNVDVPGDYTITYNANDTADNPAAAVTRTVRVQDTIKPVIIRNGPATVTAECHTSYADAGASATDSCDTNVPVTTSGSVDINTPGTYMVTYNAIDDSGNAADAVTRTVTVVDTTPPTISCPANITVYLPLNSTSTSMAVNYTAPTGTDSCGSATTARTGGLASGAIFPVGTTTNTFRVSDAAGNHTDCSFTVTVLYNFTGFFSPVNNLPTLNSVNAGKAVPVKFSLSGNKGLNIFAPDNPYSVSFNCGTGDPGVDVTETLTAGASSLSFGGDQYNYVWKTEGSWVGTCRQLVLTLNDGSVHTANFKFK
jgi:uncharacterized repeat protein (TIGR01451 family)